MALQSSNKSLAIIVPMYNEETVAALCVDKVMQQIKTMKQKPSLVIINDGSSDNTATILKKKYKQYKKNIIIITHQVNKGYGAALQTGLKQVEKLGFTWVLHMDSDLTNDPKYIHDFCQYTTSTFDCIKASRYIKGAKTVNVPLFRRVFSIIGNGIASLLFNVGIRDCTNGFRMVRIKKLQGITFKENDFSIILEEMYHLKRRKALFYEIPYTLTARTNSLSHFVYKPKTFYDYLKYALKSVFVI